MSLFTLLIWAAGIGIAVLVLYLRDPYASGPTRADRISETAESAKPVELVENDRLANRWMSAIRALGVCRRSF